MLEINEIKKILPHRYPFLLVDRIIKIEDKKRIIGIKNVSINEPFFQGHFPNYPIMPGVLIIEAMAQVGGILIIKTEEQKNIKLPFFVGVDKVRFRKPVFPGDELKLELEVLKSKNKYWKMKGKAYVKDNLVAEAELLASLVDVFSSPSNKGEEEK